MKNAEAVYCPNCGTEIMEGCFVQGIQLDESDPEGALHYTCGDCGYTSPE